MFELNHANRRAELTQTVWGTLERRWLLGLLGGAVLLFYIVAIFVQQMPGQLRDEPAGAARWTLITSETYGMLGGVLRALGLFNVVDNPLLQLLLVMIALIVLVQLGNTVAQAWRLWQFHRWIIIPVRIAGDPAVVPRVQLLFRRRAVSNQAPADLFSSLRDYLTIHFDQVEIEQLSIAAWQHERVETEEALEGKAVASMEAEATAKAPNGMDIAPRTEVTEHRILALRHLYYAFLRPLLFTGLLCALFTVWLTLTRGWEAEPAPIAPGTTYRSAARQLLIRYDLNTNNEQITPLIVAQVVGRTGQTTLGENLRLNQRQTLISTQVGPPALFLRTRKQESLLSQVGPRQMVPAMGLVFPTSGSEESVIIGQSFGLRILRLPPEAQVEGAQAEAGQFLVEVYDTSSTLVDRISIQATESIELVVDDEPVTVELIPLPSLLVKVAHQPAVWLFVPALFLLLAGVAGYAFHPAFMLVQVAPWPEERTVVVLQSDSEAEAIAVEHWLANLGEDASSTGNQL